MTGRLRAAALLVVLFLTACGGQTAETPARPLAGRSIYVLYAASLVNVMEKGLGPAFQQQTGAAYAGQGAGSTALANAIKDRTMSGDVFLSADPAVDQDLAGAADGDWLSWWLVFARTSMVVAYSPRSKVAGDFARAKAGSIPWYQVLEEPGLRLGRTDPNLDPKGYRTLFLFDLAQAYYHQPGLSRKILGTDMNPDQIFPEETLEARLESGAIDAGIFYLNEATERQLPYISLPDQINLGDPAEAASYATATWTNARGQTLHGGPILFTASVLNRARDAAAGQAFVQYLLSPPASAIMMAHGLLTAPALYGGDRASIPGNLQSLLGGPIPA